MYCLRCGRETEEEQAFCLACQKDMSRDPVDPNAVVHIPTRKQNPPKRLVKRRPGPEEQIRFLKRKLRVYMLLLAAAIALIVCLAIPAIRDYSGSKTQIGQNYSTVKPASTEPAPSE